MFFTIERQEFSRIYRGLIDFIRTHHSRPFRASTFKSFYKLPFQNKLTGIIEDHNTYEGYKFVIKLNKIKDNNKNIDIIVTPFGITRELWDKDKKSLVHQIVNRINASLEPFDNVEYYEPAPEKYRTAESYARIDNNYGFQICCDYEYEDLDVTEIVVNLFVLIDKAVSCYELVSKYYLDIFEEESEK